MSASPQFTTAALVRPAGYTLPVDGESTVACMTYPDRAQTPHEIKKYRRSYFEEPGMRVSHPGLIDDHRKMDKGMRMGEVTVDSEHVPNVLAQGPQSWYSRYMNDQAEKMYVENSKEPLGKPYIRGHEMPPKVKAEGFAYGMSTDSSESAKNLLYPQVTEDESKHHAQYIKSHGAYEPGEQRERGYKWENTPVHPAVHRFGLPPGPKAGVEGVQACMSTTGDGATRIISKRVAEFKNLAHDKLGQAKNLGMAGGRALPPDHAFGVVKKKQEGEWGAAMCVQGDYSLEEQLPDPDLGKSVAPGWRNRIGERVFGVPTLRTDIPKPGTRSIGDNQNYGDDTTAAALVRPDRFSTLGIQDGEFHEGLPKADLRTVFEGIGRSFDDATFEKLWWRASRAGRMTQIGQVCIEEFRLCMNEKDDAAAAGTVPAWWEDAPAGK